LPFAAWQFGFYPLVSYQGDLFCLFFCHRKARIAGD
jgi:hypothetical protein